MKTIEFNPDGKATAFSQDEFALEEGKKNDISREILPQIFHKMKNKLTPILGYAQMLQARTSDEFTIERLRKIEKNTAELTESLNLLKDYFKAEPAPRQPGNLNRILAGLGSRWQKIATEEKIKIRLDLDPKAPDLPLNAAQIKILLLNMADNAIAALKTDGKPAREIRLSTCLEAEGLKLVIRDNGAGMDEAELANIWTPFYSTRPDHAGLGLVVCEKIIANHGAACRVTSSRGEFSQFAIRFPVPPAGQKSQIMSGVKKTRPSIKETP
jgi:signal transduction histidine kinase